MILMLGTAFNGYFFTADLPVVYDHNNPSGEMEGMAKVIERDEYKVRKKPKGRAKFIGQSKVSCSFIILPVCALF